jgi:ATP-dependent helicase HrpB
VSVRPSELPIWQIHQDLLAAWNLSNRLVLVAPTGSGKTTQVPQMLLDSNLLPAPLPARDPNSAAAPSKIVVLQPRRVAARTVAARVAHERQVRLGSEVGYQIRLDDRTSLGTRICYVTEGILLRWFQADPQLPGVGALLFDEFHERTLLADVALALAKRLQEQTRPDLRLIVMSATLDAESVADYLSRADNGGRAVACPILISEGVQYPVVVRYLTERDDRPMPEQAADQVEQILRESDSGDILVFMPGFGEINATLRAIGAIRSAEKLMLLPLHGDLPPEDQDRAFQAYPMRKVVVATNVAETSVTIDGIRFVIDSGLARISRYDGERGIHTLWLEEISRAAADQRKGRAGRTASGTCYRLWNENNHLNRPERNTPEIQRSDLAEVVLLLHSLGVREAAVFDWLDRPEPEAVQRAEQLLRRLGALSAPIAVRDPATGPAAEPADSAAPASEASRTGDLTVIGRRMLALPMHPRYSRMLIEAADREVLAPAALCAALVSGRDMLMRLGRDQAHVREARELFAGSDRSDFFALIRAFAFARNRRFQVDACMRYGIHAQTARQVHETYQQIVGILQSAAFLPPKGRIGQRRRTPGALFDDGLHRSTMRSA